VTSSRTTVMSGWSLTALVTGMPPKDWDLAIVATGPLTAPSLASAIPTETGEDSLAFFDAITPIIYRESIHINICWYPPR
ncbi:hypothetical protein AB9F44_34655, partial [Rhizobium leguminosarum]